MAILRIQWFVSIAILIVAVRANGLPTCYIEPYASALNSTICGPLDLSCICQSTPYITTLQDDVPQACLPAEQVTVFAYLMAACSEVGYHFTLSTTSAALTTSTMPTSTITSIFTITHTQSAAIAAASTSTCPKPGASSGAIAGAAIGAFIGGGLLFTTLAIIMLRRRRAGSTQNQPVTPSSFSQNPQSQATYSPIGVDYKRPRAEMMMTENRGSPGRPVELS